MSLTHAEFAGQSAALIKQLQAGTITEAQFSAGYEALLLNWTGIDVSNPALARSYSALIEEWSTGAGTLIRGTLADQGQLPLTGERLGDGYIILGDLWVWNRTTWVNVGRIQAPPENFGLDTLLPRTAQQITDAIEGATQTGGTVVLPGGKVPIVMPRSIMGTLNPGVTLRIVGNGTILDFRGLDIFWAIFINSSQVVGALSETFPGISGWNTQTMRPVTKLSAAAAENSWTVAVDSASAIAVGHYLQIGQRRLDMRGEHRNHICVGEGAIVVAIAGNVITLNRPLTNSYAVDTVWQGAITGATSTSVTIATGLSSALVRGSRLRITAGKGAGQTRYITDYDPATGIATHDTVTGSYRQLHFGESSKVDPPVINATLVPEAGSTVVLDATPFVFTSPVAKEVAIEDLTILGDIQSATGNTVNVGVNRGIQVAGAERVWMDRVRVDGACEQGIAVSRAAHFAAGRLEALNVNLGSLGYAVMVTELGRHDVQEIYAYNCRKGGLDCAGAWSAGPGRVEKVITYAGRADWAGVAWSPTKQNFAAGTHGHARDWSWGLIENHGCMVGYTDRGFRTRIDQITFTRPFSVGLYILDGDSLDVGKIYCDISDIGQPGSNARLNDPRGDPGGHLLYLSGGRLSRPPMGFGVRVHHVVARGLQGSLLHFLVTSARPPTDRFIGSFWFSDDVLVEWNSAQPVSLIGSNELVALNYCRIPRAKIEGNRHPTPGAITMNTAIISSQAGRYTDPLLNDGVSVVYQVGDDWHVSIKDDGVARIPVYMLGSQMRLEIAPNSTNVNIRFDGHLRKNNASEGDMAAEISQIPVEGSAVPLFGTTGGDGQLNLFTDGVWLELENRSGSQADLTVSISYR